MDTLRSPYLVSLQVGMPQTFGNEYATTAKDRVWSTGIYKRAVTGPLWLSFTNLEGDGQADLTVHGGYDKAVFGYAAEHYQLWQRELKRIDFTNGAFGENFTSEGMNEDTVCIGDTFQVGTAIVQVSQPRSPCWKLARRWQIRSLPARVVATGRTGWYYRVLQEGYVQANLPMYLVKRGCEQWTISRVNTILYDVEGNLDGAAKLAKCEFFTEGIRVHLASLADRAAR
jgi:MOSC domain-containing protein YiiM